MGSGPSGSPGLSSQSDAVVNYLCRYGSDVVRWSQTLGGLEGPNKKTAAGLPFFKSFTCNYRSRGGG